MNNITVLQLISSLGFFGAENVLLELAKGLSKTNYKPIIGLLKNGRNPHIELAQEAYKYQLDVKIFECRSQFDIMTIRELRKFIEQNRITIIHPHGYKSDFYSFFAALGKNIKILATCHPWTETEYNKRAKFYSWLDKKFLNAFDKIIAVADTVKMDLMESGISEDKISVIDNGIDIERFQKGCDTQKLCRDLKIENDRIIVGTVGRLVEEKGHQLLIEATKMLVQTFPSLLVIIVGEGPLLDKLKMIVNEFGLQKHVLLTGLRDDIPEMLKLMKVFVLPSLSEGLPMALMEAMVSKKAIIATRVGGIPKLIIHERTGILINPGSVLELKEGILKLLNDQKHAKNLAQNAHQKIINEFSNKVMANKYLKYYHQLLDTN